MMTKATILTLVFATVTAVGFASTARATPWTEVGAAGDLPATAQVPVGGGLLTEINGYIGESNSFVHADMYRIRIPDPGKFSATTVGPIGPPLGPGGALADTILFLFASTGSGVYANDDVSGSPRSLLPAGNLLGPQVAGDYFIAISAFNLHPVSVGGSIFPIPPKSTAVVGPTGPGGTSPITGWQGFGRRGTYRIALTGAGFASAAVPAPATLLLLGAGLVVLALRRRRSPSV